MKQILVLFICLISSQAAFAEFAQFDDSACRIHLQCHLASASPLPHTIEVCKYSDGDSRSHVLVEGQGMHKVVASWDFDNHSDSRRFTNRSSEVIIYDQNVRGFVKYTVKVTTEIDHEEASRIYTSCDDID